MTWDTFHVVLQTHKLGADQLLYSLQGKPSAPAHDRHQTERRVQGEEHSQDTPQTTAWKVAANPIVKFNT